MEKKRLILWILMCVALLIVAIPTIPHHHHTATTICLSEPECDEQGEPIYPIDQGACDASCITHIKATKSELDQSTLADQSIFLLFSISFAHKLLEQLLQLSTRASKFFFYVEHYYDAFLHPKHGLRAPPFIFG